MANRYWVGNSGNWNSTSHWSTTSGGSSGASVPTSADDVFFNASSFSSGSQVVSVNVTANVKSMDWTGVTNTPQFNMGGWSINFYGGSLTLVSGMTVFDDAYEWNFRGRGSGSPVTITTAGHTLPGYYVNLLNDTSYSDSVFSLGGSLTALTEQGGEFNLAGAITFNTNNYNVTISTNLYADDTVTMNLGTSTLTVTQSLDLGYTTYAGPNKLSASNATFILGEGGYFFATTYQTLGTVQINGDKDFYHMDGTINNLTIAAGVTLGAVNTNTTYVDNISLVGTNLNHIVLRNKLNGFSYRNDGSVSVTNHSNNWTNPANAYDDSGSTYATSVASSTSSSGYLLVAGTNLTSVANTEILSVEARLRVYYSTGPTGYMKIYTAGLGELLGTISNNSINNGTWYPISAPTGGWSWANADTLVGVVYGDAGVQVIMMEYYITYISILQKGFTKTSGTVLAEYADIEYSLVEGGATWNAINSVDNGNNTGWSFVADFTRTAQYSVHTTKDLTYLSASYTVATTPTAYTKTAQYRVASNPSDVTKTAMYTVDYSPTITKTAEYTTFGAYDITKSASYTLSFPSNLSLASSYEVDASQIQKTYFAKVYSSTGTFLNTWSNFISEEPFKQAVNTQGSEIILRLPRKADDFGEGEDVNYRNKVQLYVVDKEAPNGVLKFTGYISNYESAYDNETVLVALRSYGADLSQQMMLDGSGNTTIAQLSVDPSDIIRDIIDGLTDTEITYIPYSYTTRTNLITNPSFETNLTSWTSRYSATNTRVASNAYAGTYSTQIVNFSAVSGAGYAGGASYTVTGLTIGEQYTFSVYAKSSTGSMNLNLIAISAGVNTTFTMTNTYTRFSITFTASATSHEVYARSSDLNATWYLDAVSVVQEPVESPYFDGSVASTSTETYAWTGTAHASTSTRVTLTDYGSISPTGRTVSYTFNTNTAKEGIDKALELAPADWYYYIDQATNVFHFHELSATPDHTFSIGKDLRNLHIKKDMDKIINTVYFSGGDTGGGTILYKKYTIPASITTYGIRGFRYKDGRVTLTATADYLADKVLRGDPEILVYVEVIDSNLNDLGYDLESVNVGETVKIGSSGIGPSSLYDIATFDTSPYDYDLTNLSSIVFQITSMDDFGDYLAFTLATTPPDITKRIQDINRNLIDIQNNDNPIAPS